MPTVPVELILLPRWFPDPSVQDELLGAHRDRAAAGAGGEAAAGAQSARRPCAGTVRAGRAGGQPRARRTRAPAGRLSSARWTGAEALRAFWPKRLRARAIDNCRRLDHRAAERRGRAGRDLSRHGQQRDDVRRAGLSAGSSRPRHRPQVGREAAGGQGRRSLLPALRLAGVGHRAGRPCADGNAGDRAPSRRRRAGSNG